MLKIISLPLAFLIALNPFSNFTNNSKNSVPSIENTSFVLTDSLKTVTIEKTKTVARTDAYTLLKLDEKGLSKKAFELALTGFKNLISRKQVRNKNVITIVDFSKPSNEKRLFVIDVKKNKLLFQSLVAHGRNSGLTYATNFSNENDSHKSSIGFYITLGTYTGEHGYALKLKGCEKGFNNNAYERAIVVHGSEYVTEAFLRSNGYLGRSWGCPALPEKMNKKIIDIIKNGSCLFLYHPTTKYLLTSPVLHG